MTPKRPTGIRKSPCACAVARRTARAVTELYDLVLSPTKLKAAQFVLLHAIELAGGELAQWQLAEGYSVATATLSRRLRLLARKGLLDVRTHNHAGEKIYALTQKGRECLNNAMPHWRRAQDRLRNAVGEDDWEKLFEILDRLTIAAQEAQQARASNLPKAA